MNVAMSKSTTARSAANSLSVSQSDGGDTGGFDARNIFDSLGSSSMLLGAGGVALALIIFAVWFWR